MSNAISKQNVPDEASESTECNKIDYNFIQWYRSPFSNRRPTKLIRAENVKLNWKNQDNPPSGIVRIAGQSTHCCGSEEAPTLNPTCDIIYNNKVLLVRKSNKNVLPLANVWHKRTSIAACSILRSSSSANVPKDWPSLMARPANINERRRRRRRATGDGRRQQQTRSRIWVFWVCTYDFPRKLRLTFTPSSAGRIWKQCATMNELFSIKTGSCIRSTKFSAEAEWFYLFSGIQQSWHGWLRWWELNEVSSPMYVLWHVDQITITIIIVHRCSRCLRYTHIRCSFFLIFSHRTLWR